MSTGRKITLGIVLAIVVVLAATVILVPLLLDINRYRSQAEAYIGHETGKPVQIGHLRLTLLPRVSIRVDDFSMGNPPGFPQGYFVKARRIYAVVDAHALWNHQVLIQSLELDDPSVHLISNSDGRWNFENPPSKKRAPVPPSGKKPLFTLGEISRLNISGGQVSMANVLASGRIGPTVMEIDGVSSQLRQVNLNAFVESGSSTSALPSSGTHASAGNSRLSSVAYAASPEAPPVAQGTLNADSLRFGAIQITNLKSKMRLFPKQVDFSDVSFTGYGGSATGSLALDFGRQNLRYSTDAKFQTINVAQLLDAFPAGRGRMTGTLQGNTKLSGEVTHSPDPLAGVRGSGQLLVRNGELPSLELNKNLLALARLANLGSMSGSPSAFSSISADFDIANQRITTSKASVVGNGVGIDGAGTLSVAGDGSLDFTGIAKLAAAQNQVTDVLMGLTGATFSEGKLSFPFRLGGTLDHPKFTLTAVGSRNQLQAIQNALAGSQTQGAQSGQAKQPSGLVQGLENMLEKKKKQ